MDVIYSQSERNESLLYHCCLKNNPNGALFIKDRVQLPGIQVVSWKKKKRVLKEGEIMP